MYLSTSEYFSGRNLSLYVVVMDTINWIDCNLNLDVDMTVDLVTRRSGYTYWYFQRKFKLITGISISEYIRLSRVINATNELITTNKNIMSIAIDNGFSSQQSFTRSFRYYFNKPPGSIRREYYGKHEVFYCIKLELLRHYPLFMAVNNVEGFNNNLFLYKGGAMGFEDNFLNTDNLHQY